MKSSTPDPKPESALDANRRYNKLMEAMHEFKGAVLEYYSHEVVAAQAALQEAGVISPSIVTGIKDLARAYATERDAIVDQMKEHRSNFGWTSAQGTSEEYQKGFIDGMEFMINFVEMSGDD